ncbi:Putative ATP-binding chaperone [Komagataella phaffii CBS 7435]|uniref:Putative ATP-binding chaperone n=1 Tax=Komagataella phaffii (strain ATCC 76273 / CBS 7435 / CECT 11047 / NRRL Y-11430 / Wegner 21-1) TaxID=981350 RepID=F2QUY6_KOMPC|nr:Putative ATP-binding chaperone [Komagataella phaffii CBS 7435]
MHNGRWYSDIGGGNSRNRNEQKPKLPVPTSNEVKDNESNPDFFIKNGFRSADIAETSFVKDKGATVEEERNTSDSSHESPQLNFKETNDETNSTIQPPVAKLPTPKQLKQYLDRFIVGQEKCKKIMSVAVYTHYVRINNQAQKRNQKVDSSEENVENGFPNVTKEFEDENDPDYVPDLEKSNVLLLGPSGSGKTLIAKTLAKCLQVPFIIQDCTSLTQAGYVGEDIESCIEKLLIDSDYDIERCEKGIIVLDEIDKLAKPSVYTGTKDIAGEGVQQGLFKNWLKFGLNGKATNQDKENYIVDTTNILFLTLGAFVNLDKIVAYRLKQNSIGFDTDESKDISETDSVSDKSTLEYVTLPDGSKVSALELVSSTDLQNYGLIPELIGRLPIVSSLSPLTVDDLVAVLTEPRNSILKQYVHFFDTVNVKLAITSKAIRRIAEISIKNGTGARGLRAILEKLLLNAKYDCPGSSISFVLVDTDVISKSIDENKETGEFVFKDGEPKYYSRGELFSFFNELSKEDEKLKTSIEKMCQIPLSKNRIVYSEEEQARLDSSKPLAVKHYEPFI